MIQSHHLPTCDDVFEVLTRGPFPTGQHEVDFPIQRHLTVCHSCRELAEALRPVTAVLADGQADEIDEDAPLPAFLAECGTPDPCRSNAQPERTSTGTWRGVQAPAIALAVCLLLLVTGSMSWLATQYQVAPGQLQTAGKRSGTNTPSLPKLAEAMLPVPGCSLLAVQNFQPDTRQKPAGIAGAERDQRLAQKLAENQCCSKCHHAGNETGGVDSKNTVHLSGPKLVALVNHCTVCHEQ